MTTPEPASQAEHNRQTREAYDRLAAVWAATTDDCSKQERRQAPFVASLYRALAEAEDTAAQKRVPPAPLVLVRAPGQGRPVCR